MESLIIPSPDGTGTLTFKEREGDEFIAEYESSELRARIGVTALFGEEFHRLMDYFDGMSSDWRGCYGVREWSSAEGEFSLSATSDWCGHVIVKIVFRTIYEQWSASALMSLDVATIDQVSRQLKRFFED